LATQLRIIFGDAILAAQEMPQALRRLNEKRAASGLMVLELGIGAHCGRIVRGFIGSEERL
jgi:class 3 adenylate cyclase